MLSRYYVNEDRYEVLHRGHGVYYGVIPHLDPDHTQVESIWVVSRKERDTLIRVALYETDPNAPAESPQNKVLQTIPIESEATHDAVLSSDKKRILATDTRFGNVIEYKLCDLPPVDSPCKLGTIPHSKKSFFLKENHFNTIGVIRDQPDVIWMVLHNYGDSFVAQVNLSSPSIPPRILLQIGRQSHGWVHWKKDYYLSLSSQEFALVCIHIPGETLPEGNSVAQKSILWKFPAEEGHVYFAKGLAVVDDIAFIGISQYAHRADRPKSDCRLVAFDLRSNEVLWMRYNVGSDGLINHITLPHVAFDSSCRAISSVEISRPYSF
jgi:hypothetical protein